MPGAPLQTNPAETDARSLSPAGYARTTMPDPPALPEDPGPSPNQPPPPPPPLLASPTVEVLCGVLTPGKSLYKEDANVFYYISKRGGVIPNLGYTEAFVIRKSSKGGLERINFNITDMDTIPVIKPGDTILLNGERATTWDKIWTRTSQVASILATIAFFIIAF